eukprot:6352069-Prymnesium_polylepis.1
MRLGLGAPPRWAGLVRRVCGDNSVIQAYGHTFRLRSIDTHHESSGPALTSSVEPHTDSSYTPNDPKKYMYGAHDGMRHRVPSEERT